MMRPQCRAPIDSAGRARARPARRLAETPLFVLTGPRGSGKTTLLGGLARRWRDRPRSSARAIAARPEVLHDELTRLAAPVIDAAARSSRPEIPSQVARSALRKRRPDSLLLLDDVTEVRTLASYPDVELPLESVLEAIRRSSQPCIASTRFGYWMRHQFPELATYGAPAERRGAFGSGCRQRRRSIVAATDGLAVHVSRSRRERGRSRRARSSSSSAEAVVSRRNAARRWRSFSIGRGVTERASRFCAFSLESKG